MIGIAPQGSHPLSRLALLPRSGLAVAVGFVICWSSGFVGSRLTVAVDTPALALYAWRFALATLLAGLWWGLCAALRGRRVARASDLAYEAVTGSLTVGVYLLAMLLAVQAGVSVGVAALIGALQPLAAITLASRWLGERSLPLQWLGMTVATIGAGLSVFDDLQGIGSAPVWAYCLPFLAVAAVTVGSGMVACRPVTLPVPGRLTAQLGAATVVFFLAAWWLDKGPVAPPATRMDMVFVLVWLIVLATFGGYGFFNESLRRFGLGKTAALVALTPAVTLGWTALLFGELPGRLGATGLLLGLLGAAGALAVGRADPSGWASSSCIPRKGSYYPFRQAAQRR